MPLDPPHPRLCPTRQAAAWRETWKRPFGFRIHPAQAQREGSGTDAPSQPVLPQSKGPLAAAHTCGALEHTSCWRLQQTVARHAVNKAAPSRRRLVLGDTGQVIHNLQKGMGHLLECSGPLGQPASTGHRAGQCPWSGLCFHCNYFLLRLQQKWGLSKPARNKKDCSQSAEADKSQHA